MPALKKLVALSLFLPFAALAQQSVPYGPYHRATQGTQSSFGTLEAAEWSTNHDPMLPYFQSAQLSFPILNGKQDGGLPRYFPLNLDYRPLGGLSDDIAIPDVEVVSFFRLRLSGWPVAGFPCPGREFNGGCDDRDDEINRFLAVRQQNSGWCASTWQVLGEPPAASIFARNATYPIEEPTGLNRTGMRYDRSDASEWKLRVTWILCPQAPKRGAAKGTQALPPDQPELVPFEKITYTACPQGTYMSGGQCRADNIKEQISGRPLQQYKTWCCGNPISPATGNKSYSVKDFTYGAIAFSRTYNSLRQLKMYSSMGRNWSHDYGARVLTGHFVPAHAPPAGPNEPYVYVQSGEGLLEPFVRVSEGVFRSDNQEGLILRYSTDPSRAWTVYYPSGRRDVFDSIGLLKAIVYPESVSQSLSFTYTGDLLQRIVDGTGRAVTLQYDSSYPPLLLSITPEGGTQAPLLRLAYDELGRLVSATYADNTVWRYRYNESTYSPPGYFPHHLTSVVDAQDNVYAQYAYDDLGRAQQSWHGSISTRAGYTYITYVSESEPEVSTADGQRRTYRASGQAYRAPGRIEGGVDGTKAYTYDFEEDCDGPGQSDRLCKVTNESNGREDRFAYDAFFRTSKRAAVGKPEQREQTWERSSAAGQEAQSSRLVKERVCAGDCATGTLEQQTTFAYDSAGRVTARCDADPTVVGAAAYTCSPLGAAPSGVRRTQYQYCDASDLSNPDPELRCPAVGLLKIVNGPRSAGDAGMNGADDIRELRYFIDDDESGCPPATSGQCHRKGDVRKIIERTSPTTSLTTSFLRYDRAGRVLERVDPNGTKTTLTYDARGKATVSALSGSSGSTAQSQFSYDQNGNLRRVTTPDGAWTERVYDDAHRVVRIDDSAGQHRVLLLDGAGRAQTETLNDATFNPADPETSRRFLQYSAYENARLVGSYDSDFVRAEEYHYDSSGFLDATATHDGILSSFASDTFGRRTGQTLDIGASPHVNASSAFAYDARGNLMSVIDPDQLATNYAYNGFSELKNLTSPDTGAASYQYDAAGNRISKTDARGKVANYAHDPIGRLASISYPTAPSLNTTFEYDTIQSVCLVGETSAQGRRTRMTDASGTTKYCYDLRGNLVRRAQTIGSATYTTTWLYDAADNVQSMTYPSGAVVNYGRNAAGQVISVIYRASAGASPTTLVSAVEYYPFGPVKKITFGNSRILQKAYDLDYRITSVTGGPAGFSSSFVTDVRANITATNDGAARTYAYDGLDRLDVVRDGASSKLEGFGYNATGDRIGRTGTLGSATYAYAPGTHRLTSFANQTRSYDPVGNTTGRAIGSSNQTWVYDDSNRMSEFRIDGQLKASYFYDGLGQRVRKDLVIPDLRAPLELAFVYSQDGQVIGEYSGLPSLPTHELIYMDDLIVGRGQGTKLWYVETDHLGTPRALIDPALDAAIWKWSLAGTAFGEHAPDSDPDGNGKAVEFNFRYPGQYQDQESGLHYNYFRDYDAVSGRYMQSDPIGLAGGISTFAYVGNDPLAAVDPDALRKKSSGGGGESSGDGGGGNSKQRTQWDTQFKRDAGDQPPPGFPEDESRRDYWESGAQWGYSHETRQACEVVECYVQASSLYCTGGDGWRRIYFYPGLPTMDDVAANPNCRCVKPGRMIDQYSGDRDTAEWDDVLDALAKAARSRARR